MTPLGDCRECTLDAIETIRTVYDPSNLLNFVIFASFWVRDALDNILTSIVTNSHFRKPPGA